LLGKAFNPNLAYDSFRNTIDGGTFGNVRSRLSARIESRFGSIAFTFETWKPISEKNAII